MHVPLAHSRTDAGDGDAGDVDARAGVQVRGNGCGGMQRPRYALLGLAVSALDYTLGRVGGVVRFDYTKTATLCSACYREYTLRACGSGRPTVWHCR